MTDPASEEADLIDSECDLVSALLKAPHKILMCSQGLGPQISPQTFCLTCTIPAWKVFFNYFSIIKNQSIFIENKPVITKEERAVGINEECGINRYTLLYINNKDLLYSTGNYIQYLLIIYNRKQSEKLHI